jgi:hypothetical protein
MGSAFTGGTFQKVLDNRNEKDLFKIRPAPPGDNHDRCIPGHG